MNWKIFGFSLVTLVCCGIEITDSANILVMYPVPARSHFKSFQLLFEELIKRGHNVTLISAHKLGDEFQSNYTLIDVKAYPHELKIVFAEMRKQSRFENLIFCNDAVQNYWEVLLQSPQMQDLINSKNNYDLVIAEMFFHDSIFAFGNKFNAPVIALSTQILMSHYNWILGNPFPPSYYPNSYLHLTEKMSLADRFFNMAFGFMTVLFCEFHSLPRSQSQIEKYFHFDRENMPHVKDIIKNISITLVASHYSFEYIKPQLPTVVEIAGLHLTPLKSLPKNIQNFMDEADLGVIYLSLGSLIEPTQIRNLGKLFIQILEKIPERVVMKWDPKLLPYIPKNILVQEWIPQTDVLSHPNCRLFITHGGQHSLLESLNASVPIIGIPFFSDQQHNAAVVEYYEMGTALKLENIPDELSSKIDEVLHNPKYKNNIEKRSQLFRERLANPLETAIFWVDHVIKHKNTAHLKPASSQLYWHELYSLDVLAIFIASILIVVNIVKFIITKIVFKLKAMTANKEHRKDKTPPKEKMINNLKYD